MAQTVKDLLAMRETRVQSLGWEYPLEKGKATQSSILAWRIPWTEELGRLQSMGYKESDMTDFHFRFSHKVKVRNQQVLAVVIIVFQGNRIVISICICVK